MLYLVLSITCYVITSVTLKLGAQRGCDAIGVNLMVRASGMVLTAVLLGLAGSAVWHQPHLPTAGIIGTASGVCTFLSGYASLQALGVGSLNATWTVMRISTVMPVLASILLWGELREATNLREVLPKVVGIICLLTALVLLGRGRRD